MAKEATVLRGGLPTDVKQNKPCEQYLKPFSQSNTALTTVCFPRRQD